MRLLPQALGARGGCGLSGLSLLLLLWAPWWGLGCEHCQVTLVLACARLRAGPNTHRPLLVTSV